MDSFEITKIVGAVCGSFLIFLLVGSAADSLVNPGHGSGHGDAHHNAYVIEVEEEASEEEEVIEVAFADVYAEADAAAGESLWRACQSCHKLEPGANAVGPYLHGIVGRDIASADGFSYSDVLKEKGDIWSPENLSAFLENPTGWAPRTKMAYKGMRDVEDRANLIAYLATIGN